MKPAGWRVALYLALVFVAGVVVGALAHRYVLPGHGGPGGPPHKSAESFRKAVVEDLTKRLNLDAGQVAQLQRIMDDAHRDFQDFRERHKDEMKAIMDRQHGRISDMLRPDQRVAYEKIEAERRERIEREQQKK